MIWVDSMVRLLFLKLLFSINHIPLAQRIQEYRNIMELVLRTEQDPLVMMAWRCKKLEEIVIHGYVLDPHNLVGISRLRGRDLKVLEVSRIDLSMPSVMMTPFIEVSHSKILLLNSPNLNLEFRQQEISTQLGQKWAPLDPKTLPAALGFYPVSDDVRDQYILRYIRNGSST